ncbi:hypothetical protein SO802_014797 [Lithocarpus litseifolius]|uniref:Uncharacterized protein n=1 Tax=Lithocarpus litseifolius TaxID=425828 RepID=A0AAW2CS78_9ROSI
MDRFGIGCNSSSVTFFFARLGVFVSCSSGFCSPIRDFAPGDSGLSLVLGELHPLLCESLSWFELVRGVLEREKMSFDGRSGDLGAILSSSAGVGEVETDTAISRPAPTLEDRPKLESRFVEHVHAAIQYASTIEDFDDLVDPRTLAHHCLGPEPSHFVLRAIHREEKKMMTKFNQEFYARIKGKKNEPLSSLGQRRLRLTDKEREKQKEATEKGSSTPVLDEGRAASPALSVEEISPRHKKRKTSDKETILARANEVITSDEMKEIFEVPSYEMVNCHVHKLVQVLGESMHITSQYLASEEKAVIATLRAEALEAKASGLRKDLIMVMDETNLSKEKIKVLTEELEGVKLLVKQKDELLAAAGQKMKKVGRFELLRRYLIKHGPSTNLEELDFEIINKEIEADEATQAAQAAVSAGEDPKLGKDVDSTAPS